MNRHNTGHVAIAAFGFLLVVAFATSIAPGKALLLPGTGVVFGFSARALFDQSFGGNWFWPFGIPAGRKTLRAKAQLGQRYSSMVCQ